MELGEARNLVTSAIAAQRNEFEDGFVSTNFALHALLHELSGDEVAALAVALRRGSWEERNLSARLLIEGPVPAEQRLRLLIDAMADEANPTVLAELVTALGFTRLAGALSVLLPLSEHSESQVRFQVASALSSCGTTDNISDALVVLSSDEDSDVRWSAAHELLAIDRADRPPAVQARLDALREDTSDEVRKLFQWAD